MFKIGTVCMKIAGRDAGKTCVIVEEVDDTTVLIEGATRRRKCNVRHLEPLGKDVDVKKGADNAAVMKALGLEPQSTKPKKATERPRQQRKIREKVPKVKKTPKKSPKDEKEAPKVEKPAEKPKEEKPAPKTAPKKESPKTVKKAPVKKTPAKKKAAQKKS